MDSNGDGFHKRYYGEEEELGDGGGKTLVAIAPPKYCHITESVVHLKNF